MNFLLAVIALLIAFAVLKLALMVFCVALVIALLVSFAMRPRHTLLLLGCVMVMGLASAHPITCIIALGVVGLAAVILSARRKRPRQLLLTDGRRHR